MCSGGPCECCEYMKKRPGPAIPEAYVKRYNGKTMMQETTMLANNMYLDELGVPKKDSVSTEQGRKRGGSSVVDVILGTKQKRRRVAKNLETGVAIPQCVYDLRRFQRTLDILMTRDGADIPFKENDRITRILTATHMSVIVGKKAYKKNKLLLHGMVDTEDFSMISFLLWVTSRQQGKTTVLARFATALMLTARESNLQFINVYSTTKEKAVAIVTEVKEYMDIIRFSPEKIKMFADIGMTYKLRLIRDTQALITSTSMAYPGVEVVIKGRPAKPDSCRGEAPRIVIADEFSFLGRGMWDKFMLPLFAVQHRVGSLCTTPGPPNSGPAEFMRQTDIDNRHKNEKTFFLVNHSFMCDLCQRKRWMFCYHMLFLLPPWKSNYRIKMMASKVPEDKKADFFAEVYGRRYDSDSAYFPEVITTAAILEPAIVDRVDFDFKNPVVFGCDPASHAVSAIGFSATIYDKHGHLIILGHAEIKMQKCQTAEVQMCMGAFVRRVLMLPVFRGLEEKSLLKVLPVVETNNCDIISGSIVSAINNTAVICGHSVLMPFTKDLWGKDVRDGVGIITTAPSKMRAILGLYETMSMGTLKIYRKMVTLGAVHLREEPPSIISTLTTLRDSLVQYKDTKNGKVSGVTASTKDDGSDALLFGAEEGKRFIVKASRNEAMFSEYYIADY
jgi:hypothetical protein